MARASVDNALSSLNLDDDMREILIEPWREIQVGLPVRMDDGTVQDLCASTHLMRRFGELPN